MVSAVGPYRNSNAKGTPPNLPDAKKSAPAWNCWSWILRNMNCFMAPESGLTGGIFKYLWHLLPSAMERVSALKWLSYIRVMESSHIREEREKPAQPRLNLKNLFVTSSCYFRDESISKHWCQCKFSLISKILLIVCISILELLLFSSALSCRLPGFPRSLRVKCLSWGSFLRIVV